ncbi:hypothetical protein A2U01_0047904, partial [Trifolium medium]|nr:hypothetical protein [Trifolium medium]
MAALIKNPSMIGPPIKVRVKQIQGEKKLMNAGDGTSNKGEAINHHESIDMEEDVIESEKKRMRNGHKKDETIMEGVKANNEAINMHVDVAASGAKEE